MHNTLAAQQTKDEIHESTESAGIQKYTPSHFEKERLPYTMIPNRVIQELAVRHAVPFAIWCYLQSLPESWTPNKKHILKTFGISERTYHKHMKFLVAANLIMYVRRRRENGQLGPVAIRVLNGSKIIIPDVVSNTAKICIVDEDHTATNAQCGDPTSLECCAHINKTILEMKEEENINKTIKEKLNKKKISKQDSDKALVSSCTKETKGGVIKSTKTKRGKEMAEYKETLFPMPDNRKLAKAGATTQELALTNPLKIPDDLIADWLAVRAAKKAPVTPRAWKYLNGQLERCENPVEAFEIMVAHGWTSLNHRWIQNMKAANKKDGHFDDDDTTWADKENWGVFG